MKTRSTRISTVIRPDTQRLFVKGTVEMSWSPGEDDPYKRPRHTIGALNFPIILDNFLAFCEVPGQIPFSAEDQIDPDSLVVGNFEFTATHHDLPICIFGEISDSELMIGGEGIGQFHHAVNFDPKTNRLKVSQGPLNTGRAIELRETFKTPCGFIVRACDLKDIKMGFYITAKVTKQA